jgi:hypothetical protein
MNKLFNCIVSKDTKTVLEAVENDPKLVYYTNGEKMTLLNKA